MPRDTLALADEKGENTTHTTYFGPVVWEYGRVKARFTETQAIGTYPLMCEKLMIPSPTRDYVLHTIPIGDHASRPIRASELGTQNDSSGAHELQKASQSGHASHRTDTVQDINETGREQGTDSTTQSW